MSKTVKRQARPTRAAEHYTLAGGAWRRYGPEDLNVRVQRTTSGVERVSLDGAIVLTPRGVERLYALVTRLKKTPLGNGGGRG